MIYIIAKIMINDTHYLSKYGTRIVLPARDAASPNKNIGQPEENSDNSPPNISTDRTTDRLSRSCGGKDGRCFRERKTRAIGKAKGDTHANIQ